MKYRGLLLVVVVALLLPAAPAAACQPMNTEDYLDWYDFNLLVDSTMLPANVTVAGGLYSQSIIVRNSGSTPLYVIAPSGSVGVDQPVRLPEGWVATHKLERDRLFIWKDGHWNLDESIIEVRLRLDAAAISPPLPAQSPSGPNRPDAIPDAADAKISLFYHNERLDVPITLKYNLNPHYDPARYEQVKGLPCSPGSLPIPLEQLMLWLVLCLFVLGASILVIWFIRSAPRPPASQ
jgi:hypothetical protein